MPSPLYLAITNRGTGLQKNINMLDSMYQYKCGVNSHYIYYYLPMLLILPRKPRITGLSYVALPLYSSKTPLPSKDISSSRWFICLLCWRIIIHVFNACPQDNSLVWSEVVGICRTWIHWRPVTLRYANPVKHTINRSSHPSAGGIQIKCAFLYGRWAPLYSLS